MEGMGKDTIQDIAKVILHLKAMEVTLNPHITRTNRLCTVANHRCMETQIQCTTALLKVTTRMATLMETRMEIHIKQDITLTVVQIRIGNFDELFIDKYKK